MKKFLSIFLTLAFVLSALSLSATNAAPAGAYSRGNEEEPNDDPQNATSIVVNASYDGSISSSSDADWYVFTLSESGTVYFSFEHDAFDSLSSSCWKLTVYDPSNYTGLERDLVELMSIAFRSDETNSNSQLLGLKAGTYYVNLTKGASHSSETYTLTANYEATSLCEIEPNDDPQNASDLLLNKPYAGSVDGNDDVDWFKFTLSESGTVYFSFEHDAFDSLSSSCWKLTVYDPSNYTGLERDLVELMSIAFRSDETNSTSQLLGLKAGTYYVNLTKGASHSSKTYTLTANYEATSLCEIEPNDDPQNASELLLNNPYVGSVDDDDDVDWFKFTLSGSETMYFNLAHDLVNGWSSTYWKLTVYDSSRYTGLERDLVELMSIEFRGDETDSTSEMLGLAAGTYYVKITEGSGHSWTTYTLTITDREPVHEHSFDGWESDETQHWHECTECGEKTDTAGHVYDNAIDADCNVCGAVREVSDLLGDANGDGAVNNIDASLVLQHDAGVTEIEGEALAAADVNDDGAVNNIDASRILQLDAGVIDAL